MLHESRTLWPFSRYMWEQTFPEMRIFWLWVVLLTVHRHIWAQVPGRAVVGAWSFCWGSLSVYQMKVIWHMMQKERHCGGQGLKKQAELLLPAAQQGEQLNFPTLASGSPVDFHLLDHFCHMCSLLSPHTDTCCGHTQCFKSRLRWFFDLPC